MRVVVRSLTLLVLAVFVPAAAFAQAVIAGTVKDASGAVLPGVTVEAASPALIEKVRIGVTDGTGQYRIEDLRPGTYTVTFTLAGLQHLQARRHRADRLVHGDDQRRSQGRHRSSETITVTGETPVVDVQSARREMTLNNDILKSIPTVRSYNAMVIVVPGRHHQPERRRHGHLDDAVSDPRRTQQRGPH